MGQKRIILAVMQHFISAQHAHKLSYDDIKQIASFLFDDKRFKGSITSPFQDHCFSYEKLMHMR